MNDVTTWLADLHARLHGAVTAALAGIGDDPATAPLASLLAFALGMVHALMPGHGKTAVFSYFLGAQARLAAGIAMAARIAFLHVGTAIILLLIVGAATVRFGRLQGAGRALEIASCAAVALLGAWLLYRAIAGRPAHGHEHSRRAGLLGYAIGLLPCPLTIILMNYALVNGTVLGGLALTAVMALGIATTMSLTGMSGILARRALASGFDPATGRYARAMRGLEIVAALIVLAAGATMLARTL
jgi:ABC-type nickel/cobalt efflux system permease component RcnA